MSKNTSTTKMTQSSKTSKTAKSKQVSNTDQPANTEQTKTKQVSKSQKNLNNCVGFVYGGSLIKASNLYLFSVDSKDVVDYVQNNLTKWFGNQISGRFVKCEDASATLQRVIELATERKYLAEPNYNILKVSVTNGVALLKEVSGATVASTIKLVSDVVELEPNEPSNEEPVTQRTEVVETKSKSKTPAKTKAPAKTKGDTKKKGVAKDSDSDDNMSSSDDDSDNKDEDTPKNKHSSDDEADNSSDSDGGSDSDSEDEPAPVKPVQKTTNTKSKSKTQPTQNAKKRGDKKGKS